MKASDTTISSFLALTICLSLGCGNVQDRPRTDTSTRTETADATSDGGTSCYENGEPFPPPEGEDDPTRLDPTEICCNDSAQTVIYHRIPDDGQCKRPKPVRYVCLNEAGDGVCDPEENFCTSPRDCQPPSDDYPLCCREGDVCSQRADDETGVAGCCDGYEHLDYSFPDERTGECGGAGWAGGGICVKDCGDGSCTTGENRCNCPEDCEE